VARHSRKQIRGDCAGLVRLSENHVLGAGKQHSGDLVDGFIAHRSVDENDAPTRQALIPKRMEFACSSGIVRAIEIDVWVLGDVLNPAGPLNF
jgi:hypothetical protein